MHGPSNGVEVKVGDLVTHTWSNLWEVGLVVDWYDTANGYVVVRWYDLQTGENPCHISKLEVISESR